MEIRKACIAEITLVWVRRHTDRGSTTVWDKVQHKIFSNVLMAFCLGGSLTLRGEIVQGMTADSCPSRCMYKDSGMSGRECEVFIPVGNLVCLP